MLFHLSHTHADPTRFIYLFTENTEKLTRWFMKMIGYQIVKPKKKTFSRLLRPINEGIKDLLKDTLTHILLLSPIFVR